MPPLTRGPAIPRSELPLGITVHPMLGTRQWGQERSLQIFNHSGGYLFKIPQDQLVTWPPCRSVGMFVTGMNPRCPYFASFRLQIIVCNVGGVLIKDLEAIARLLLARGGVPSLESLAADDSTFSAGICSIEW